MICARCSRRGEIELPYLRRYFCSSCFSRLIERRFKREMRKLKGLQIAANASPASLVGLFLLKRWSPREEFEITYVDQGIGRYSERSIEKLKGVCERFGYELRIVKAERGENCEECRRKREEAIGEHISFYPAERACAILLRSFFSRSPPLLPKTPFAFVLEEEIKRYASLNGIELEPFECPLKDEVDRRIEELVRCGMKKRPGACFSLIKAWGEWRNK